MLEVLVYKHFLTIILQTVKLCLYRRKNAVYVARIKLCYIDDQVVYIYIYI